MKPCISFNIADGWRMSFTVTLTSLWTLPVSASTDHWPCNSNVFESFDAYILHNINWGCNCANLLLKIFRSFSWHWVMLNISDINLVTVSGIVPYLSYTWRIWANFNFHGSCTMFACFDANFGVIPITETLHFRGFPVILSTSIFLAVISIRIPLDSETPCTSLVE